jgi:hypothetical protein
MLYILEVTSVSAPSPLCSRILLVSLLFDTSIEKTSGFVDSLGFFEGGESHPVTSTVLLSPVCQKRKG